MARSKNIASKIQDLSAGDDFCDEIVICYASFHYLRGLALVHVSRVFVKSRGSKTRFASNQLSYFNFTCVKPCDCAVISICKKTLLDNWLVIVKFEQIAM